MDKILAYVPFMLEGTLVTVEIFMLTLLPAGTEAVMNALAPITVPSPMTVSPPRIEAPE